MGELLNTPRNVHPGRPGGPPGGPRGPRGAPLSQGGPPGRAPPAGYTLDTPAGMVEWAPPTRGTAPRHPRLRATGVPSCGHEGTHSRLIPVGSSLLRHDLADTPLRHSLRAAFPPRIHQGQLPRCVTRSSAPLLWSLGVQSPAPSQLRPAPPHRGVARRGPSMPHHRAGGSLSASDTPPCGGCISPPGDPPPDPRKSPKNAHFLAIFGPGGARPRGGGGAPPTTLILLRNQWP